MPTNDIHQLKQELYEQTLAAAKFRDQCDALQDQLTKTHADLERAFILAEMVRQDLGGQLTKLRETVESVLVKLDPDGALYAELNDALYGSHHPHPGDNPRG